MEPLTGAQNSGKARRLELVTQAGDASWVGGAILKHPLFSCLLGASLASCVLWSGPGAAQPTNAAPTTASSELGTSKEMGEVKASSEADYKKARLHFTNGVALLQESPPNYQDAWQQFRLALVKSGGSWKVRGNLGYCALKLERDGEALEHYRVYLEEGGDQIDPKERADIERELLLLEGNMSWVTVTSSTPDVELAVSRAGSSTPTQAYTVTSGNAKLGLRAGSFTITATSGDRTLRWEPLLTPGKQAEHHFDFDAEQAGLEPSAAPATTSAATIAEDTPRGPSTLQIVGYAGLGAGVLAAGAGIVTGVLAKSNENQAKENCVNDACPESDLSKKNSAQSLATVTNVLFITGGVLAAAGVSLVIVGKPSKKRESTHLLQVSPGVAAGGASLFLSGTY